MTARSLLITAIVAATAASGASHNALSEPVDAQSQAAALLSHGHTRGVFEAQVRSDAPSSSVSADAQARAAALLTGRSASGQLENSVQINPPSVVQTQSDAHAQAAALLSGSRTRAEPVRTTATAPLGDHPAVLVAKQWRSRAIDPNQFIVAHPARLALD
jgi:hypothetical protein